MKEVKITLTNGTLVQSYNIYLSVKNLAREIEIMRAQGLTYQVVCQYTSVLLASN